jgi:hypothetical protein
MSPETLAAIVVCVAGAITIFLAWRFCLHLRQRIETPKDRLLWKQCGPEAVWDVYDKWRDAELGIKYLEPVIARLEMTSRTIDIVIALSTASSVSSLALFRDFWWGAYAWNSLAGLGGLLAVIKPFFQFQDAIKNRQELLKAYTVLCAECEKVIYIIRSTRQYDDKTKDLFRDAKEHFQDSTNSLAREKAEIATLSEEKRKDLMERVEHDFPEERFVVLGGGSEKQKSSKSPIRQTGEGVGADSDCAEANSSAAA